MTIPMSRRWKLFLAVGLLSLAADQITKIWARQTLPTVPGAPGGRTFGIPVEVIPNFWDWRLTSNPGASFSLFHDTGGARIFLSITAIIAAGVIVWMVKKARDDQTGMIWALGLLIGGVLGNLVDRVLFGAVTDFVVWKYHDTEWPTFNVADVTLVVGVGLLFLATGKEAREAKAQARQGKDPAATRPGDQAP